MFTFNFTGRITAEPRTQVFGDRMLVRIPVASNTKIWSSKDGKYLEKASFADLSYNVNANSKIVDKLRIGRSISASGRIQTEIREKDGVRKTYINYNVSDLELGADARARDDAGQGAEPETISYGADACPF